MIPPGFVLIAIGVAAALATLFGGALALRQATRVHLILGLSAGLVIGVALLDLTPEALTLAGPAASPFTIMAIVAGGFLAYMAVDRLVLGLAPGALSPRGHLGAGALCLHSLLDGLGVGLAFQVSAKAGLILAAAVLAHDLADGLNTVNVSLAGSHGGRTARRWLIVDALAPLVGIALSRLFTVPAGVLAPVIAAFAGFFLYIGVGELLPDSQARHPRPWTTIATGLGVIAIGVAIRLAASAGLS